MYDFEKFFQAYLVCALWSSNDESDENGGEPMDANYGTADIDEKTKDEMREECKAFFNDPLFQLALASDQWDESQGGHDFWLTRNGHGAGFWDRGKPLGDKLTELAKPYGSVYLWIDDGKVHA